MALIGFTITGAAEATSLPESEIIAALKSGDLPARRLGNEVVLLSSDLLAWLETLPVWAQAS